jgi:capsular polysaccharide biosynthesis protein
MNLPAPLRPWWSVFKRVHRFVTWCAGLLGRAVSRPLGSRGVPLRATERSLDTARLVPGPVTVHPGAAAQELVRRTTPGHPAGHPVFAEQTTTAVPATFTLEIRGGRLTGDYGAASTPGKILDHETSTYFGVTDWREHPLYLHPTLGRIETVDGTAVSLTTRGCAINYYHFLYDSIARLGVLEAAGPDVPVDAYVVPHATRYQRQLLELAGLDADATLIQPERGMTVVAERLLVPSNPNWALQAPPDSVAWLRERLRPSRPGGSPRRLYITRGTAPNTRRYCEEEELVPELERRGFTVVDPGTLSVQEQIDTFADAEIVLAPHGAGLTNVTFSPPDVRVLEMFASTYVHLGLWAICEALGAQYRYLVADGPSGSNSGVHDDVSIPPPRVLAAVDELLG